MTACMGGWCHLREHCARYRAGKVDKFYVERLCEPKRRDYFILRRMD